MIRCFLRIHALVSSIFSISHNVSNSGREIPLFERASISITLYYTIWILMTLKTKPFVENERGCQRFWLFLVFYQDTCQSRKHLHATCLVVCCLVFDFDDGRKHCLGRKEELYSQDHLNWICCQFVPRFL